MLDADGSTDPNEIPLYVGALVAGAEFVKGTRFAQGAGTADMSLVRRLGNRLLVFAVRLLFGGRCSDLCYGYMAFWKRVLPRLELDVDGFEIETQMSVKALGSGLKVVEVPSFESRRLHGKSNLRTIPDGWRVLKTIVREWRLARKGGQPQSDVDAEQGGRNVARKREQWCVARPLIAGEQEGDGTSRKLGHLCQVLRGCTSTAKRDASRLVASAPHQLHEQMMTKPIISAPLSCVLRTG
jgi:hypothetical protein